MFGRPPVPVPPAIGDPSPAWPLVHPSRKVTDDFGKPRRGGTRIHVAEDLPAPRGTIVVAPESGVLVRLRETFTADTGVAMLQGDSGLVIALGEIEPRSWSDFGLREGSRVVKGEPVARVGSLEMLHLETYAPGTTRTFRWMAGEPPPAALRDPLPYVAAAARAPEPMPPPSPAPVVPPELPPLPAFPPAPIPPAPVSAGLPGGAAIAALILALGVIGER